MTRSYADYADADGPTPHLRGMRMDTNTTYTPTAQQPVAPPGYPPSPPGAPVGAAAPPPKKKRKGCVIAAVIAVVLLCGCVGAVAIAAELLAAPLEEPRVVPHPARLPAEHLRAVQAIGDEQDVDWAALHPVL